MHISPAIGISNRSLTFHLVNTPRTAVHVGAPSHTEGSSSPTRGAPPPLAFPTMGVTSRMVDFTECEVGIFVVLYSTLIHAAATSKAWDDPKQQMGT